jgi:hypothetical protein
MTKVQKRLSCHWRCTRLTWQDWGWVLSRCQPWRNCANNLLMQWEAHADPSDPVYAERWQKAQPENDLLLRGSMGVNAFMRYQNEAQ